MGVINHVSFLALKAVTELYDLPVTNYSLITCCEILWPQENDDFSATFLTLTAALASHSDCRASRLFPRPTTVLIVPAARLSAKQLVRKDLQDPTTTKFENTHTHTHLSDFID